MGHWSLMSQKPLQRRCPRALGLIIFLVLLVVLAVLWANPCRPGKPVPAYAPQGEEHPEAAGAGAQGVALPSPSENAVAEEAAISPSKPT